VIFFWFDVLQPSVEDYQRFGEIITPMYQCIYETLLTTQGYTAPQSTRPQAMSVWKDRTLFHRKAETSALKPA
jgi:hypothetical protein